MAEDNNTDRPGGNDRHASSAHSNVSRFAVVSVAIATYHGYRQDRVVRLGAGLAYYALFAAVPLATSAFAIAGVLFDDSQIRSYIADRFANVAPSEIKDAAVELAATVDTSSAIASLTAIGVISGIVVASLLFVALQDSFNVVWNVPVGHGLRNSIRRYGVAILVVLLAGGLLTAALIASTLAVALDDLFPFYTEQLHAINDILASLASWGLAIVGLSVLFQLLTPQHLPWLRIAVASAITTLLLVLGTWALGAYLQTWGSVSLTGVAGSVLVLLIWLYYEAQIVIVGAELLKALTARAVSRLTGAPGVAAPVEGSR